MIWRAEFADGPLAAEGPQQLHFGWRPLLEAIYMARLAGRWVRVGSDQRPWPEQITYHPDPAQAYVDEETRDLVVPYRLAG